MQFKETIILAPGANETELLRSLAKQNINTFGVRVFSSIDLAKMALERNGVSTEKHLLDDTFASFYAYKALEQIQYFKVCKLSDATHFVQSINNLREYIVDINQFEKLLNGEFLNKNVSVLQGFKRYLEILNSKNLIDKYELIRDVISSNLKINVDIKILKSFSLKPLDIALIKSLTNKEPTYLDLEIENENYSVAEYNSFFGEKAEAEHVIKYIIDNNIKFDEVTVAVSNAKYANVFQDLAIQNNLPIDIGMPRDLRVTMPGQFLLTIINWMNGFYNKDELEKLFSFPYIDKEKLFGLLCIEDLSDIQTYNRVVEAIGKMRISLDCLSNEKKIISFENQIREQKNFGGPNNKIHYIVSDNFPQALRNICNLFNNGFAGLFSLLKIDPDNKIDEMAKNAIVDYVMLGECLKVRLEDLVENVQLLSLPGIISNEGSLYVTTISKAKNVIRKHLFVLGLSNELYPGSPKEDFVLLDMDYNCMGYKGNRSHDELLEKSNCLLDLLKLNSKNKIYLSYPYYETDELKSKNASALLFDIFSSQNNGKTSLDDFNKIINKHGYFDSSISVARNVNQQYLNNIKIIKKVANCNKNDENSQDLSATNNNYLDKYYSASAINTYFLCPYKFYLKYIVGCEDPFLTDPIEDVAYNDIGNVLHKALEDLNKNVDTKDEFLNDVIKVFKSEICTTRAFLIKETARKKLDEILSIAAIAYDMASLNMPYLCETEIFATHPSGVKLHGLPDRIEIENDSLVIIDYKTESKVERDASKVETLGQILTYAYLVNNSKHARYKVKKCIYRYIRLGQEIIVEDQNLENHLEKFDVLINQFKNDLTTGNFIAAPSKSKCKYCNYKDICNRHIVLTEKGEISDDEDE
ncbi:MAG: PD-(D/E)XK nuclease family protein [Bacilli bacterium]|nr:PD-(D/E)XK nuclease family protein [Bacilli bacterium]